MKGGRKALQEKKQFGFFAKICRSDFWILLLSLGLSVDVVDQRKHSLWRIETLLNFPVKSRALKARLSGLNKVLLLCDSVFHTAIMSQEIRWGQNIRKLHSLYSCVQTLFCFWTLLCVASSQQGIFRHFCEKTPSSLKSQIPRPFRLFNSLASFKSQ